VVEEKVEVEAQTHSHNSDADVILGAIKELTKQLAENTKVVTSMKANHDRWIRAGKFVYLIGITSVTLGLIC